MNRIITHFFPEPPEDDSWIPLVFISREYDDTGTHYLAFEKVPFISAQDISARVADGDICALANPCLVAPNQLLWLSPGGKIWLARSEDPLGDGAKLLLQSIPRPRVVAVSTKERIAHRFIGPQKRYEMLVLPCDYVRHEVYRDLVQHILSVLLTRNSAVPKLLAHDSIPPDSIPVFMADGLLDFCMDPFWATSYYSQVVDIVPFGRMASYCCFVAAASNVRPRLTVTQHMQSVKERIQLLWQDIEGLEIGLLAGSVSAGEVRRALADMPGIASAIHTTPDIVLLRDWIAERPDARVIFCDHASATVLNEVTAEMIVSKTGRKPHPAFFRKEHVWKDADLIFRFASEVPVGFAYVKGDERWHNELRVAFAISLLKTSKDIVLARQGANSWDEGGGGVSIAESLRTAGIDALGFCELCDMLQIGDAVEMLNRLREAVQGERFEDAPVFSESLEHVLASLISED